MNSLYESYLEMIGEAEYFMRVHNIKMSGTNVKPGTGALVITKESLDKFAKKLRQAENKETEAEKRERKLNLMKSVMRQPANPYNVPEQDSESDPDASYFPLGRF